MIDLRRNQLVFFGHKKQSSKEYYSTKNDFDMIKFDWQTQPRVESEDRIFSKQPILKHIDNYFSRIDILIQANPYSLNIFPKYNSKQNEKILDMLRSKIGDRIYIYCSTADFNSQKNDVTDFFRKQLL